MHVPSGDTRRGAGSTIGGPPRRERRHSRRPQPPDALIGRDAFIQAPCHEQVNESGLLVQRPTSYSGDVVGHPYSAGRELATPTLREVNML